MYYFWPVGFRCSLGVKKENRVLFNLESGKLGPSPISPSLSGLNGEEVFEAYAEQNTPAAYRIFFFYGKPRGVIVIIAITQHP